MIKATSNDSLKVYPSSGVTSQLIGIVTKLPLFSLAKDCTLRILNCLMSSKIFLFNFSKMWRCRQRISVLIKDMKAQGVFNPTSSIAWLSAPDAGPMNLAIRDVIQKYIVFAKSIYYIYWIVSHSNLSSVWGDTCRIWTSYPIINQGFIVWKPGKRTEQRKLL